MPRQLRTLAFSALFSAASLGAATSCGRFHHGDAPERAALVFINESLGQADVFIVVPGTESRRIGTVFPGRTDTLMVPTDITSRASSLQIVARVLAHSTSPSSGPISISPGEYLQVTLPSDLKSLIVLPVR